MGGVSGDAAGQRNSDGESGFPGIHAEDRPLLGVWWEGSGRNAPVQLAIGVKIFNAVADALQWILQQQGVENLDHYLDMTL